MITVNEEKSLQLKRERMPILNKAQIELCLFDLEEYENFEAKLATNARLRIQYNSTVEFFRISQLTESIQDLLEKTDKEMDEFWLLASEI